MGTRRANDLLRPLSGQRRGRDLRLDLQRIGTGKGIRRLTNTASTTHSHQEPAVSPDGRRIAFSDWDNCAGGTASARLRVIDTDGRPTRDLVKLRRNGYYLLVYDPPSWSPDGRWIAFMRDDRYGPRRSLLVVHPDGTGLHFVAQTNSRDFSLGGWLPSLPK